MVAMIFSMITFLAGITGLVLGWFQTNLLILLAGGFISIIGVILFSSISIVSYIQTMDNRNISAINEVITGLSD